MRYSQTPFQAAWRGVKDQNVFGCPDCSMPIDEDFQKTNIRKEKVGREECRILSCPWCYRVMNIGPEEVLPLYC